jgi:hypothetical protein
VLILACQKHASLCRKALRWGRKQRIPKPEMRGGVQDMI